MNKIKIADKIILYYIAGDSPILRRRTTVSASGVHTHFTNEVFFVTDGTLTVITDSGTTSHGRSVVIIPPRIKHTTIPDSDGCYCLLFEADGVCFDSVCELALSDETAFYITEFTKREGEARGHLAALIFEDVLSIATAVDLSVTPHISAIDNYINIHLTDKLTLSDVAKAVHLSEKQVSRIVRHHYGMGFCDVITDKRMAKATMMLKDSDMRVSDIAKHLFCGNEAYFYTLFKKKYGVTPLNYKKAFFKKDG